MRRYVAAILFVLLCIGSSPRVRACSYNHNTGKCQGSGTCCAGKTCNLDPNNDTQCTCQGTCTPPTSVPPGPTAAITVGPSVNPTAVPGTPCQNGGTAFCDASCNGNPACSATCHNNGSGYYCTFTTADGCTGWGDWGACTGGYQTRYCTTPSTVYAYQIQTCGGSSGGSGYCAQLNYCNVNRAGLTPYTCYSTNSSYGYDTTTYKESTDNTCNGAGNYCYQNLQTYLPGTTTNICYADPNECQQNCCRPVYWCDNTGAVHTTSDSYYSNTYNDCNNNFASTCTQNLQNIFPPSGGTALYNYNCYGTSADAAAHCITPTPLPTAPPQAPIGNHDGSDCSVSTGWACDATQNFQNSPAEFWSIMGACENL